MKKDERHPSTRTPSEEKEGKELVCFLSRGMTGQVRSGQEPDKTRRDEAGFKGPNEERVSSRLVSFQVVEVCKYRL